MPTRAFERQLDWIRARGYDGCSIERALQCPSEGQIAISFDDGEMGQYEHAFPALVDRGMTATFLVTTGWVGQPGFMTWEQLRVMKAAGMSIQSHTRTHPFLSELIREALVDELANAKAELDRRLTQTTTQLALPGGDPPQRSLRSVIRESGYSVVATSWWGTNETMPPSRDGVRYIKRCTVRGAPNRDTFERIVGGDYWTVWRRSIRDGMLRTIRTGLGPSRYHRWRRRVLDAVAPGDSAGIESGGDF